MKIVCDSCSAKYSIADDKVRGKVFKIRCKKCSNIIVVRGNAGAGGDQPAPTFDQKETRVFDYQGYDDPSSAGGAAAAAGDEAVWHLVIDQEQVGPMTAAEVRERFGRGELDPESYVWREGFADWLPLSSVDDFAGLGAGGGEDAVAGMFGGGAGDEAGTKADPADLFAAASAEAADDDAASDLFGAKSAGKAAAHAADDADGLFGAGNGAGKRTSGAMAAQAGNSRLRGERNENSVLFSLNNLAALATDTAKAAPSSSSGGGGGGGGASASSAGMAQAGGSEGSGLIDIRSMASVYRGDRGGGSLKGGPLGDDLPVFNPAISEQAVLLPSTPAAGNSKLMYILLGAVALLAVVLVVLIVIVFKGKEAATVAQGPAAAASANAGAGDEGAAAGDKAKTEGAGAGDSAGSAAAGAGAAGSAGAGTPAAGGTPPGGTPAETAPTPPAGGDGDKAADKGKSDKGRDKSDRSHSDRSSDKSDKGADKSSDKGADKGSDKGAEPASTGGGGCMDEVGCLLADKPPACCAKYKKGGGGSGGSSGGGGGAAKPASDLPESLGRSDISKGMESVRGRVAGCGDKSPAKGIVKVSIKVGGNGSVQSVSVKEAPDPKLGSCVAAAVQKASFPKTQSGGTFSYPYKF